MHFDSRSTCSTVHGFHFPDNWAHIFSTLKAPGACCDLKLKCMELIFHDAQQKENKGKNSRNPHRFDLKQAMQGNFEFVDWLNSDTKTYPVAESLMPSDWLTLAKRSITAFKFYDSAVDFVRQGLDTSPRRSKLLSKFLSLAKHLAQFNNDMLTKTGQVVGPNYSITPDLLTPDLKVNNTPVGEDNAKVAYTQYC